MLSWDSAGKAELTRLADWCKWDWRFGQARRAWLGGNVKKKTFSRYFCNFLFEIVFIFLPVLSRLLLGLPTLWSLAITQLVPNWTCLDINDVNWKSFAVSRRSSWWKFPCKKKEKNNTCFDKAGARILTDYPNQWSSDGAQLRSSWGNAFLYEQFRTLLNFLWLTFVALTLPV